MLKYVLFYPIRNAKKKKNKEAMLSIMPDIP